MHVTTMQLLRASKAEHWKARINWLAYTLLGLAAPFVIGFIVQLVHSKVDLTFFLSNGEMSIYAASLLVSVLYALDKASLPAGSTKLVVYLLLLVVSSLYATIIFRDHFKIDGVFDNDLFQYLSLVVFVFALIATYVTSVISDSKDTLEMEANIKRMLESRVNGEADLEAKFDHLGKQGGRNV